MQSNRKNGLRYIIHDAVLLKNGHLLLLLLLFLLFVIFIRIYLLPGLLFIFLLFQNEMLKHRTDAAID